MSAQVSQNGDPNAAGNGGEGDLGLNDQELLEEKERLEEQLIKQNIEIKEKNEKLLELLDEIEEIKHPLNIPPVNFADHSGCNANYGERFSVGARGNNQDRKGQTTFCETNQ